MYVGIDEPWEHKFPGGVDYFDVPRQLGRVDGLRQPSGAGPIGQTARYRTSFSRSAQTLALLQHEAAQVSPASMSGSPHIRSAASCSSCASINLIPLSGLKAPHLEAWHVTHLTISWRYVSCTGRACPTRWAIANRTGPPPRLRGGRRGDPGMRQGGNGYGKEEDRNPGRVLGETAGV